MPEKAPEGPKPGPGPGPRKVESQADIIARLEKALAEPVAAVDHPPTPDLVTPTEPAPQPSVEPAFNFVDKRNAASQEWSKAMQAEDAQAKLDAQLNVVESKDVAENPFVEEVPPAPAPAITEAAIAPVVGESLDVPEAEAATPQRGQSTHHDYHTQRPADGSIYRTSKNFQRAPGGSEPAGIAKNGREEYDKQNGVDDPDRATKHYDEVNGLNEKQVETFERPSYETMDTDQLVFAYAKAEMVGDKHVTDDIRNVYTTAMEEEYTKPGSPISYEEHEDAIARFDRMADAAIAYEKAKDPEHSALVDAAVERANKEPTIGDKLKKWWGQHKEPILNKFRPSYWAERWTNAGKPALEKGYDKMLNAGVDPEDDPEEVERKRKRNRVFMIAGAAAVTIAAIAGPAFGIGFAMGGAGHHGAAEALNSGAGHGGSAGDILSKHDQSIADALTHHTEAGAAGVAGAGAAAAAEAAAKAQEAAQHVAEAIPTGFNISSGEGGLELFGSLNIDPSKWAANASDFVTKFPQDFYNMPGGGVGIAHQGLLSPEARNAIEALR